MKKLTPLPLILFLGIVMLSCKSFSRADLLRFFSKSIHIDFEQPKGYNDFSKYEKDAVYLIELIEQAYPRLESKIADYDSASQDYFHKVSLVDNKFGFQVETQKFLAQLKDGDIQ